MKHPITTSLLSDDIAAIKEISNNFIEAINAKDWDKLMTCYTEHAIILPPNSPMVEGIANIKAFFEVFPPINDFSVENVEIEGRGDMAYVRGNYSMTITAEDGTSIKDNGKYIEIRRKQDDGTWPLSRDIFNSNIAHE